MDTPLRLMYKQEAGTKPPSMPGRLSWLSAVVLLAFLGSAPDISGKWATTIDTMMEPSACTCSITSTDALGCHREVGNIASEDFVVERVK